MKLAATLVTLALLAPAAARADHAGFGVGHRRTAAAMPGAADEPAAMPRPMAPTAERRATTVFGLPRNVGPVDRVLRTVVGIGLAGLGAYGLASDELSTTTSGILLGVSVVPFATAATGYCPLYQVVGIDRSF